MPKCRTCHHWVPWFVCIRDMRVNKIGFCGHKDVCFNRYVRNTVGVIATTKFYSCSKHETRRAGL